MTSLFSAMKMLIVAQNIIEEQNTKIKMLEKKNWKMKCKISSLENRLMKRKHHRPSKRLSASIKKEHESTSTDEDVHPRQIKVTRPPKTSKKINQMKIKLENSALIANIKKEHITETNDDSLLESNTAETAFNSDDKNQTETAFNSDDKNQTETAFNSDDNISNTQIENLLLEIQATVPQINQNENTNDDLHNSNNCSEHLIERQSSSCIQNSDENFFLEPESRIVDTLTKDDDYFDAKIENENINNMSACIDDLSLKIEKCKVSKAVEKDKNYIDSGISLLNDLQSVLPDSDRIEAATSCRNVLTSLPNLQLCSKEINDNVFGPFEEHQILENELNNINRSNVYFNKNETYGSNSNDTDKKYVSTKNKVLKKKSSRRRYSKKKLKNAHSDPSSSINQNISGDILNIRSVFGKDDETLEVVNVKNNSNSDELQYQDHADELIRIVEQDQMELFTTEDKDTFVISLNGDVDPDRLKQLLNEGILTIHVDDEDKNTVENVHNSQTENNSSYDNYEQYLDTSKSWNSQVISNSDENVIVFIENGDAHIDRDIKIVNFTDNTIDSPFLSLEKENENICSEPMKITEDKKSVLSVINNEEQKNKKLYTCDICSKVFTKKDNYKSHIGSHSTQLKRHKCDSCEERFSWRSSLVRHVASKHKSPESCSLCPATYSDQSKVKQHVKRHHLKEKKHCCTYPDCGRRFFKKYNLTLHIRTHTKQRPNVCNICEATFNHISHKKRHEQTHYTPVPLHGQKILRYRLPSNKTTHN